MKYEGKSALIPGVISGADMNDEAIQDYKDRVIEYIQDWALTYIQRLFPEVKDIEWSVIYEDSNDA